VGGTSLTANPVTGAYISETAWNNPQADNVCHYRLHGGESMHSQIHS
jgi:hypothetical protein